MARIGVPRTEGTRVHYAWVVAGVAFATLA